MTAVLAPRAALPLRPDVWRALLLALAAVCATLVLVGFGHLDRVMTPGVAGTFGIRIDRLDQDQRRAIVRHVIRCVSCSPRTMS